MEALNYAGRTIAYFTGWGTVFGIYSNLLVAWLIRPFNNEGIGYLIGAACGFLVGLIMAAVQTITFHQDIDLRRYQRWSALGMGAFVACIGPVIMLALVERIYGNKLDDGLIVGAVVTTAFLGSLSAAHITRHYLVWRATLLLNTSEETEIKRVLPPLVPFFVEFAALINKIRNIRSLICLYGLLAAGTFVYWYTDARNNTAYVGLSSLGPIIGPICLLILWIAGSSFVIAATLGLSIFILTLLKKVIFKDYHPFSPHTTRVLLTILSFFLSLAFCRWMLLLALIFSAVITYYIYHTLALPEEAPDKDKRKEKTSPQPLEEQPA